MLCNDERWMALKDQKLHCQQIYLCSDEFSVYYLPRNDYLKKKIVYTKKEKLLNVCASEILDHIFLNNRKGTTVCKGMFFFVSFCLKDLKFPNYFFFFNNPCPKYILHTSFNIIVIYNLF